MGVGFSLRSSYPQAFLVHSSDPFMFVNDLSHSSSSSNSNISWIPALRRTDSSSHVLEQYSFAVYVTNDVYAGQQLSVEYGDSFWLEQSHYDCIFELQHYTVDHYIRAELIRRLSSTWNRMLVSQGTRLQFEDIPALFAHMHNELH